MIPRSIRWRLPLSYVAIALLATLALGVVLLTTLLGYYRQREIDYLKSNAQAISSNVGLLVQGEAPREVLQSQIKTFAFLSQTRVKLIDLEDKVMADSGDPAELSEVLTISVGLEAGGVSQAFTQQVGKEGGETKYTSIIAIDQAATGERSRIEETRIVSGGPGGATGRPTEEDRALVGEPGLVSRVPAVGTQFGFGLGPEASFDTPRSSQVVRLPFLGEFEAVEGFVELSDGPAIGRQILKSVAWGWAFSSAVAVFVAAATGWIMSRGLTAPLLALTAVTTRMAGGELSTRAQVVRKDELGQLSSSFNDMAERVENTVLTLRRFVADAAHQLHTPLTALRTNLELMSGNKDEANDRALIDRAQAQVRRIESLSAGMLDLSRIESDAVEEERGPVDIGGLVEEAAEIYASQAEQARLSFTAEVGDGGPTVLGSETQLRQALANLLDNAVKFTPEGGRVAVSVIEEPGWVAVQVEDTGIGIPAEDIPHLFSRFHRGRNSGAHPGNGLGLAIVRAIAEGHGGAVTAENADPGARLSLRLPLIRPSALA